MMKRKSKRKQWNINTDLRETKERRKRLGDQSGDQKYHKLFMSSPGIREPYSQFYYIVPLAVANRGRSSSIMSSANVLKGHI